MRIVLALLLALIALGVLGYFCIGRHAPIMAEDLRQRAGEALTQGGYSFAKITDVSGRDLTLAGEAPNEDAKIAALTAVDKVWGVRAVTDKMTVAASEPEPAAPAPYLFDARYDATALTLTLTGTAPSEEVRRAILARIKALKPDVKIDDRLTIRAGAPNAHWPKVADAGLVQLLMFETGSLKIEDLAVSLEGAVKTQDIYETASKATQGFPAPYTAAFNGTVIAPPEPPATSPPPPAEPQTAPAEPAPVTPPIVTEPPPVTAPATREDVRVAENCQRQFNAAFSGQTINFESGSADITRSSQRLLRRLATIAGGCPKAAFTIAGHTDNEGAPGANMRLSQDRAEEVKSALVKFGVARNRMTARGYGETRPIASNKTERGRAQNRRIVFVVRR